MIKTFKSKTLAELFRTGKSSKIDKRLIKRIIVRLDRLDISEIPEDMNLPGFNFHSLVGYSPTRYSVHVNGPWCITFEFNTCHAYCVDLEQYH
ncbi:type II toxin-antitoxin system RelE/ParE family toxin [Bartonella sp. CB60]|uniref:type II toxin-antitoxin system RelE/ParE family toxin n=1 Tax=Bartonella sp. CB60 TaxID=3113619 RepID=UPI00300DEDFE